MTLLSKLTSVQHTLRKGSSTFLTKTMLGKMRKGNPTHEVGDQASIHVDSPRSQPQTWEQYLMYIAWD